MSVYESMLFIVHFMHLMHASSCPFPWYDDDVACSMFRFLQNCLHVSETKLPLCLTLFSLANDRSFAFS